MSEDVTKQVYEQFLEKKKEYKRKLHEVLKDCDFNGAGMRELIGEFSDEVLGS